MRVMKLFENWKQLQDLQLSTGEFVKVDKYSHIHKDTEHLLVDVLSDIESTGEKFIKKTIKFDHNIGKTHCVVTDENDLIYYKKRGKRKGQSRMVAKRETEDCDKLTIVLLRMGKNYKLLTTYVGGDAEPEVWNKKAFKDEGSEIKAIEFWDNHALIEE